MIGIIAADEVRIDSDRLQKLLQLLKIENQTIASDFLAFPEDEQNFYGLFAEAVAPNFLLLDWKWKPQDLFQQIKQALGTYSVEVELLSAENNAVYLAYDITFLINGETISITVQDEEPNLLFEAINERLENQRFIDINFQGDEYAWLLTSKVTDIREVASIIGYTVIDPINIKRDGFKTREELRAKPFIEYFDVNQPLAAKTFFYPAMYHRVDGVLKKLIFKTDQSVETQYHFVVEQGQRLHDVMTETLQKDIDYRDVIEMDWVKPANIDNDEFDQVTPLYKLQVYLVGDIQSSITPDGLTVSLEDTPEIY